MAESGERRRRLRAETTAEIKRVALELMSTGGPGAITLRAIAREMGMTANAIYGYFPTRDDLVTTLIADVYTALADTMEKTWATAPGDDPAARIRAWADAFRAWALTNPEGFRLIYGDPVPGYTSPEGGPAPDAARRMCLSITAVAADAWPTAPASGRPDDFTWSDFDPALVGKVRAEFPDLPPAAVALALRLWARLHGLISLEVYGHLRTQTPATGKLYREDLDRLLQSLGLTTTPKPRR